MEAERLAIYFEEEGAYQYKKNKEMESQSRTSSGGKRVEEVVELEIGDPEDDED